MTTDKYSCRRLAAILAAYGVKDVVLCPGARDLPLITAFVGEESINCHHIVDERTAGFVALGMAEIAMNPVALVCTSGSAVLNFAPAVAEAYYKRLPLIVISADRPLAWIDQDDSQTIRQNGILRNIVKDSVSIISEGNDDISQWYIDRLISDGMLCAIASPKGPIHINVHLDMPLANELEMNMPKPTVIDVEPLLPTLTRDEAANVAKAIQERKKVLLYGAFNEPDARLSKALGKISRLENVIVVAENLANIHLNDSVCAADSLFEEISESSDNSLVPELLITFGGSPVSAYFKKWIRKNAGEIEHWHVSPVLKVVDTYKCLSRKFVTLPSEFFSSVAARLKKSVPMPDSRYRALWLEKQREFFSNTDLSATHEWNEKNALRVITDSLPLDFNVQVSNGMTVRNMMEIQRSYKFHRIDGNRGVSGIDGSTSTSLGASIKYKGKTVLFSGDMSARYDFGAILEATVLTENFKMVLINNGGGNIFRNINTTKGASVLENYLYSMPSTRWKSLCESAGWKCMEASGFKELKAELPVWLSARKEPSLLIINVL